MTKKKFIVGSRGSILALTQTKLVIALLKKNYPEIAIEIKIIKTLGDKITDVALSKIGGKGFFVKEIEETLLAEKIDFAVHSGKDLPTELPAGLIISAYLKRENPQDVIITENNKGFNFLKKGNIIGTSSLRRKCQLLNKFKNFRVEDLRGNLDTRLKKLQQGKYDAIILAFAGLKRLGFKLGQPVSYKVLLPAVAQGAILVESREKDKNILEILQSINHFPTEVCIKAERKFLSSLEGGCQVPVAALATCNNKKEEVILKGRVISLDGNILLENMQTGSIYSPEKVGEKVADNLIMQGADKILKEVRNQIEKQ